MEQQKFIKLLKQIVREELRSVIKEELTEILQEGLQSTINEMATSNVTKKSVRNEAAVSRKPIVKNKVEFGKNKFSDILNETESLKEQNPIAMNSSYAELMTEDISMTSADALNFGAQRGMSMHPAMQAPSVITDPETGKNMTVDPIVAKAMTRDYSALMKAMDAKKNR
jgi:hypothetical protein